MKRVLVTGGSGFVGRPLVEALAQHGYTVRAAIRRPMVFPPNIEVVVLPDGAGRENWFAAMTAIDVVVHLAGIAHAGAGIAENEYDRVNRGMTTELASAAADCGIRRFIFISSIRAQTGPTADHVLTESDMAQPTDAYGRSKLAAEEAVKASGAPFTIFRPVLIYGPGVKGNLATLVRLAATSWPLPIAAFTNLRSLLAVDNLIAAVRLAIEDAATAGETYVISDPTSMTLAEIVTILRDALGRPRRLFKVSPGLFEFVLKFFGRTDLWDRIGGSLVVDSSKLTSAGWRPVIETGAGLATMVHAGLQPSSS